MHLFWSQMGVVTLVVCLGLGISQPRGEADVLRFSDTPHIQQSTPQSDRTFRLASPPPGTEAPEAPASAWFKQHGWKRAWPLLAFGKTPQLQFAGPHEERYLQIVADSSSAIWGRKLEVDPHQWPILEITWGVDRFPQEAALDVYDRNDCPIVLQVSFGPKVASGGLLPDVPRSLAFFWGETEQVGAVYTCITPRHGPADKPLQCKYPHVKYIALRSGGVGTQHTDRVNLAEHFRQHFPQYWQQHQKVPPVVAIGFEVRAKRTKSVSSARLYAITFTTDVPPNEQLSIRAQDGK